MGFNTFPCNPYPISTEELNKGNNDDLNARVAALESDVSDLNSNKANQITIAPFFSEETAYTAGDLVYYNGLSYRCTNDHEGAWDADDFAATTISNELDSLKSGLITMRIAELTFTNAGYNLFTNNGTYSKTHHTLISSDEGYVVMGGTGAYVRLIEYSNTTGNLVPCSESTVTMNCIIIEWD